MHFTVLGSVSLVNITLIVGQGSRMIVSGELNAGTVVTVILSVMIGALSLAMLGPRIETFAKAIAASQKIFQTLQRIPTIDSLDENGEKPNGIKGNFELKGVHFIFPARPEGSINCLIQV
jgi:ATP-binding cassette, subfamily B (MDR/TAP), member 1